MAKIKQVKMRLGLNPEKSWLETVVNINYDSTDRSTEHGRRTIPAERFYINLPQVVAAALGAVDARGNDQDEVMERFKEAIEQFKKLKTEVNRVILYRFEGEPKPTEDISRSFTGVYKVSAWVGTYEETVAIAGDDGRRYSYEMIDSDVNFGRGPNDYVGPSRHSEGKRYARQVPWTEQNAAFFVWIKDNLTLLIERLHELEQPDNLIDSINAGRLLPLGDPNKPT